MTPTEITGLTLRRKRPGLPVDFGSFFMFFGISGIEHGREERLRRRFEREYYPHVVTLRLSGQVTPGRYHLRGLPGEADRRGWTVQAGGTATADLSDEGLHDLNTWRAGGGRQVELEPLG
ncbi:hypothetical protein Dcar01_00585 [Deinococcus carri]|uniref:Uncharacterized protein n=1 Tax=Deinococcus carri TaxID=1211323 RepID=A0ABP9W448_9DEIO